MGKRNKKRVGYKPKYKGVRYVTNTLLKKYPKRYNTRSDASVVAKELVSELKANKIKVTGSTALKLLVSKRKESRSKKNLYQLPEELLNPKPYYDLIDYVELLGVLPELPIVRFTSNIIPSGLPDIMGGNNYDYYDYFVSFVNYIDSLRDLSDNDLYTQEWFVRCTVPKRSKKKVNGVYEYVSRIIACDVTGLEISDGYGFDPNNVDKEATSKLEVEKKEVPNVVEPTSDSGSELDKQIELKKLDIESDKLKIAKADKMLELLKAGVPYADAKKILGI